MRSLMALLSRTGAVLCGLDLLLLVPAWLVVLWGAAQQDWIGLVLDP